MALLGSLLKMKQDSPMQLRSSIMDLYLCCVGRFGIVGLSFRGRCEASVYGYGLR